MAAQTGQECLKVIIQNTIFNYKHFDVHELIRLILTKNIFKALIKDWSVLNNINNNVFHLRLWSWLGVGRIQLTILQEHHRNQNHNVLMTVHLSVCT